MTSKFISCAAAALTLASLAAGQVSAAPISEDTVSVRVDLRDLDLHRAMGLQTAMTRIENAAVNVCGGRPDIRRLDDVQAYNACHRQAMGGASEHLKIVAESGQKNAVYAIAVR